MENIILIPGRDGYSTSQCGRTMTVAELIEELSNFDENAKVYLSTGQRYGVKFTSLSAVDFEPIADVED